VQAARSPCRYAASAVASKTNCVAPELSRPGLRSQRRLVSSRKRADSALRVCWKRAYREVIILGQLILCPALRSRGLTLRSSGQPTAGGVCLLCRRWSRRWLPLISNVRPRLNTASSSAVLLRASHALSREMPIAAGAPPFGRCGQALSALPRRVRSGPSVLRRPAYGRGISEAMAGARAKCHPFQGEEPNSSSSFRSGMRGYCRSCAVAQHRSATPVQAPAIRPALPALVCFGMQTQGNGAAGRAWPNPSIEGTASGLRPPAAPHVKR
jgi:hypothetical protein